MADTKTAATAEVEDTQAVRAELLHSIRGVAAIEVAQRLEPVDVRSKRMWQWSASVPSCSWPPARWVMTHR